MTSKIHLAPIVTAIAAACLASAASAQNRTENIVPNAARILKAERPAQCREFSSPAPVRRTTIAFPDDGPGLKGEAALLVRVSERGEFLGVVDAVGSDPAYIRAAETGVAEWTFKPALCNGEPVASSARAEFRFRREGPVELISGASAFRN